MHTADLAQTLVTLARNHGWTTSKQRSFIFSPFDDKRYTRIDFARGFHTVRIVFTLAGSVQAIRSRKTAFGDVYDYGWQPGGASERYRLAAELLTTGIIKNANFTIN